MASKPAQTKARKKDARTRDPSRPYLRSIPQAAEEYGLTVWTLKQLIWNGELEAVQFIHATKKWIDTRDLESVIARNKQKFG